MCANCRYWKLTDVMVVGRTRFAPCKLVPDTTVKDSRRESGYDMQNYVMAADYECERFEQRQ